MKILIAEDDRVSREILVRALETAHHNIQIVTDGSAALAALVESEGPLIALLDWVMPGLDGPEVCRRVRALSPQIQPYIIIVSAKSRKGEIATGLDAGADDFLTKPIDNEELLARVRVAERTVGYQLALQRQLEQFDSLGRRYSLLGEIVGQQLQPPPEALETDIDPILEAENAPPPLAPAPPPPTWFSPGEIETLVPRALTELGLSANPAVADRGERATGVASFTTWAGFVDLDHDRWIDLVIEIDSQAAAIVYERALRRKPRSPQEICGFLAEIQTVVGAGLKAALQSKGGTLIAPLLSRAQQRDLWEPALRIPAESESFRFALDGVPLALAVVCYPCAPRPRSPWDLRHHEILACPYPSSQVGVPHIGERGAALTDHLIKQIADHADRMPKEKPVSVYELSPIAQRFHRPSSGTRAI
ncbi:MAG: response regulator transcription factor [Opitutaceae bacterium]|nr:response regulator transcription factor [Opitutaceae bacterium]